MPNNFLIERFGKKFFTYCTMCFLLLTASVMSHAQQTDKDRVACDLTYLPARVLIGQGSPVGMKVRLPARRFVYLPNDIVQLIPVPDMTIIVYADKKIISYQIIDDKDFNDQDNQGLSMSMLYKKVYGLLTVTAHDDDEYNIAGLQNMLHLDCEKPDFQKYVLKGGDIAVVQWLDDRYWVLVFPEDKSDWVYNLDFRNFSESEVTQILSTWSMEQPRSATQ